MKTAEKKPRKKRVVRRKVSVDGPRPVDVHVGSRLRQRRTLLGISQEQLAESVSLTFQQIQKYERGANRMGASRLYELGGILDVPIGYFFDEMPKDVQNTKGTFAKGMSDQAQAEMNADPLTRRETLELVRAYYKIVNPTVRKRFYELIRSIGKLKA
ncbi:MAG: helix-turn-helix transcriptional regulator [Rhodospirillales bacterium]|nr:helix-turn-helix transcriptional regulator [Rhodospirillales bacterium]